MTRMAIIGGTGLTRLPDLALIRRERIATPFGEPSADLVFGRFYQQDLVFLARHGDPHTIPPHKVNYRANVWALKQVGVTSILAVGAVGGIRADMVPGKIAVPDQAIDYTYGRSQTFFEDDLERVTHIDFTHPYSQWLREKILVAAKVAAISIIDGGIYGCTQGPRLETAAEISRMERDGCAMVGMTGMPEASLAREAGLDYACCAVVANWAAGKSASEITMAEIEANLVAGMTDLALILRHLVQA
jgi:5'-methylthioinosine phosphorylase